MAYESIDKLKVYMQKKINAIVTGEQVKFNINAHQLLDEISELERKAKAMDEISNMLKRCDYYDRDTALDVIEIVDKYEESADDER
ncbi:hypothetical protein AB6F27_05570 [Staphylococcus saprophyticus]|uniref:Uncharacterized protein n=1 Tax=uncultured Caudovirales phage TaxID=2100421 RepID=A0A2H4JB18_9CAUD|nr:hypothetical protein 7S15_30 [uncultured Caudovirales phage]MDW4254650.1 hypothetical protein [Staphylococcus saprophyticus]